MSQDQSPPRKRVRTVRGSSALSNSRVPALRSRTTRSMNDEDVLTAAERDVPSPPQLRSGHKNRRSKMQNKKSRQRLSNNSYHSSSAATDDDHLLEESTGLTSLKENATNHFEEEEGDGTEMNGTESSTLKKVKQVPNLSPTDQEIVRLIGQHLENIGLVSTAHILTKEAGIRLNEPTAALLKHQIMSADFDKAVETLEDLKNLLTHPDKLVTMKFFILEHKFLECLGDGDPLKALMIMQYEIAPMGFDLNRTHELTCYLMISDPDELRFKTRSTHLRGLDKYDPSLTVEKSRLALVERLQEFFPPSVVLPPKRLMTLLHQAARYQTDSCIFHNVPPGSVDLTVSCLSLDHLCSKKDIPNETIQILNEHKEEVWFCKFSPDGLLLASGSKDNVVVIWDFDPDTRNLTYNKTIRRHAQQGSAYFSWSPCSSKIAVAGSDENEDVYVFDVASGEIDFRISGHRSDVLTAVAWSPDGKKIVVGGTRGQFYQADEKGNINDSWEGVRVYCLAYRNDNKTVLATDTHFRLRAYNFEDLSDVTIAAEDQGIISFSLDDTDTYALLNINKQGLHLWDIREKCLVRKFRGVTQGYYTIYSCFGGMYQNFIASGSEDSMVYIYHKNRETPVSILCGHARTVNCVSWNPVYHNILVSASDDGTLRVWGPSSDILSSEHDDALMEDLQLSDKTTQTKDSNGSESLRNGGS